MKKASKPTQGNAFTSLQGSADHRDAQRLQAAKEGLPSWTQNERDVIYVKGDDDHRISLKFRCSGCHKLVVIMIRRGTSRSATCGSVISCLRVGSAVSFQLPSGYWCQERVGAAGAGRASFSVSHREISQ